MMSIFVNFRKIGLLKFTLTKELVHISEVITTQNLK
jgi:hypothetical protein